MAGKCFYPAMSASNQQPALYLKQAQGTFSSSQESGKRLPRIFTDGDCSISGCYLMLSISIFKSKIVIYTLQGFFEGRVRDSICKVCQRENKEPRFEANNSLLGVKELQFGEHRFRQMLK